MDYTSAVMEAVVHPIVGATEDYLYDPQKSLGALILHGLVAWLNTLVPTICWFSWKGGGSNMNQANVFYWAWYVFWVSHLVLWAFPAFMFLFTFYQLQWANRIFLFSIDLI